MKRTLLVVAVALVAFVVLRPGVAQAGPWCAVELSAAGDGATNCGFVTWEQCMWTARSNRGYCTPNPADPPRAGLAEPKPRKKAYRKSH